MNDSTYMFLNSIRFIDTRIKRLQAKRYQLEVCLLPTGIRYDKDRVQTSPEDTITKICAEIAQIDADIATLTEQRYRQVVEVDRVLGLLKDNEQTVLILRYVQRIPVKEIAKNLQYSVDNIQKIRRAGVDHLTEILERGAKE